MTGALFVCAGNICRSPVAEGIFRRKLRERGLEHRLETGAWHDRVAALPPCACAHSAQGEGADPRTVRVLERYGAGFAHTARQVRAAHIAGFEQVLVMDRQNLRDPGRMPPQAVGRARLMLDGEVPDRYYGDLARFEAVYALLDRVPGSFLNQAHATG